MKLVDIVNLDNYIVGDSPDEDEEGTFELPDTIPLLPLRGTVAFPGTVMPLAIGRQSSIKLVEDCPPQAVLGLVAQKSADIESPTGQDIYRIGTAASVLKVIKMPQGTINLIAHGVCRFKILEIVGKEPYLRARVEALPIRSRMTKKMRALVLNARHAAERVFALSPNLPEEASVLLENVQDPSSLADFIAATLNLSVSEKQQILEQTNVTKRLENINRKLADQLEVLELSNKIHGQVRESIDKSQREYFLQEELKAIQAELGQTDRHTEELDQLEERILATKMSKKAQAEALRELDRMSRLPVASPEYGVIRSYLDWMCELPWSISTEDKLDIQRAERVLNKDHYGLEKVKKRIIEFLAVRKLNPKGKSPILCFVGPPGVGKTSLGKSIARAMGRNFIRISLGGIRDEADIRGHRRTYIGALPGRILQELRKTGSRNPVFMLDELDKIGQDFHGDPASALLEVLDPQQNDTFTDHYLDQPFDLSDIMFIGTANYTEPIPEPLLDRMETIELPGYTQGEKLKIATKYLVPRQIKENGLKKNQINIKPEAIDAMIDKYTREAGVRNLERTIAAVCRSVATRIAKGTSRKATIGASNLAKILGPREYEPELAMRTSTPGVATGLAYTPEGGEILFVESAQTPGKGELNLTGQIGEVMKESAQAAWSIIKADADKLGLDEKLFSDFDYHVHVPAGAVPKDGPSAGCAIYTSLLSLLQGRPIKPDVAMTGEITLKGLVLPVGGLKEKIIGAKRAGIKTVILPSRNRKDIKDLPKEATQGIDFVFVNKVTSLVKMVFKN
ncbi:endopeptidase La [Anaerohalosphaera lusitana]|nr:endopeptidase La [Anaerohalosphaera lusitana]